MSFQINLFLNQLGTSVQFYFYNQSFFCDECTLGFNIITKNFDNAFEDSAREMVMAELKRSFRPEFLNRLDEIVFYKPLGKALGAGTLAEITYNSKKADMKGPFKVNMKSLLETYNTDLAGNARVVNGKVDLGCYQAQ